MSGTGNKLVLAFNHSINSEEVILRRSDKRQGNTLNQIGQVMDALVEEGVKAERERILSLLCSWDGNERVYNSCGDFDPDSLREALNPKN